MNDKVRKSSQVRFNWLKLTENQTSQKETFVTMHSYEVMNHVGP